MLLSQDETSVTRGFPFKAANPIFPPEGFTVEKAVIAFFLECITPNTIAPLFPMFPPPKLSQVTLLL